MVDSVIQKIIFKRGTKAALEAKLIGENKPLKGEPIFETDTNKFKIGNGVDNYIDLPYISGSEGPSEYIRTASVSGNTLTLTKQDGTTIVFTPEGAVYTAGNGIKIEANVISIDENYVATKTYVNEQVAAETSARIAADNILQANISAETSARILTDASLSARIEALEGRGRYLSTWNSITGLPTTSPTSLPYNYKSGDYYLVEQVGVTNYKPTGIQYTGVASTIVETNEVVPGDTYYFDGTNWSLVHTPEKQVVWGEIGGTITNQQDLQNALNAKQNLINESNKLSSDLVDDTDKTNKFVTASEKAKIAEIDNKAEQSALTAEISRAENIEASLSIAISAKQDILTAGSNITIENNVISAKDTVYAAGSHIEIINNTINVKDDFATTIYVDEKVAAETSRAEAIESAISGRVSTIESDYLKTSDKTELEAKISAKSTVSVSATGTATEEVQYITIDGVEKKLAGSGEPDEYLKDASTSGNTLTITKKDGTVVEFTPSSTASAQVLKADIAYDKDHAEALEELESTASTCHTGDIAILRQAISSDSTVTQRQYTAYVYDSSFTTTTGHWIAMDGNYSADSVILKENITLAGNYTQVGNLTKTQSGTATFATKGKSVTDAFKEIFSKRLQPSITEPSLSISSSNIGSYEVGTNISVAYNTSFSAGSYTYGPATGVTAIDYTISFNSQTVYGSSGTFDNVQVTDSTNLSISGTVSHTAGVVAKDNLGDNSDPVKQISAGTKSASKGTLKGFRKIFWGYSTATTIDSAVVRALVNSKANAALTNEFLSEDTSKSCIIIAAPTGTRTLSSVTMPSSSEADVTSQFVKQSGTVSVEGANGFTAAQYDIWLYKPATMAGTYKINMK